MLVTLYLAMPKSSKRESQLVDARASKPVKMPGPEVAFHHAEDNTSYA